MRDGRGAVRVLSTPRAAGRAALVARARADCGPPTGADLAGRVSCESPLRWSEDGGGSRATAMAPRPTPAATWWHRLRAQAQHSAPAREQGCEVDVVPASTTAGRSRAGPDGIFLSNGPGDPAAIRRIREHETHARRGQARVRDLPRPPDPRPRARRRRRSSSSVITAATIRSRTCYREGRDQRREPRLCGRRQPARGGRARPITP